MRKQKKYLNSVMLSAAFLFLLYASITLTPTTLKHNANDMLAAVGIGVAAAVPPNEYNTLAAELSAKEARLNQQQAEQNAKGYGSAPGTDGIFALTADRYGFYSLCISTLLFILVAVNFYYDIKRRNSSGAANTTLAGQ
jgi:hypothetical protein